MPKRPSANPLNANPTHWEERSAQRVLEASREQLLERSRLIVDTAYELLDDAGLDGLTIRAVLTRTGLSRRAFYERFEGKDDLVLAVFEEAIRKAVKLFGERTADMADPLERLRFIVTSIVMGKGMDSGNQIVQDRRGAALSREHLRLGESRPQDLRAALQPLIALIEQQLADGMTKGVVRRDNPHRLATLLYNLVSTTAQGELLLEENAQPDQKAKKQLAHDIWEFCRRAISA